MKEMLIPRVKEVDIIPWQTDLIENLTILRFWGPKVRLQRVMFDCVFSEFQNIHCLYWDK